MGTSKSKAERQGFFLTGLKKLIGLGLESLGVADKCLLILSQSYEILPSHPEVPVKESRSGEAAHRFPFHF